MRRFEDLPENARRYVARLEEVSGVPAAIVSTGSERDDTILRDDVFATTPAGIQARDLNYALQRDPAELPT